MGLWLGARLASGEESSSPPDWVHHEGLADSSRGHWICNVPKWQWPKKFPHSHRLGKHKCSFLIACVTFLQPITGSQPSAVCSQIFSTAEGPAHLWLVVHPLPSFALFIHLTCISSYESYYTNLLINSLSTCIGRLPGASFNLETNHRIREGERGVTCSTDWATCTLVIPLLTCILICINVREKGRLP